MGSSSLRARIPLNRCLLLVIAIGWRSAQAQAPSARVEVRADSAGLPIVVNGKTMGVTPATLKLKPDSGIRIEVGRRPRTSAQTLNVAANARLRVEFTARRDTQPVPRVRPREEIRASLMAEFEPLAAPVVPKEPKRPTLSGSLFLGGVLFGAAAVAGSTSYCDLTFTSPGPAGGYVNDVFYPAGQHSLGVSPACQASAAGIGALVGTTLLHVRRLGGYRGRMTVYAREQAQYQLDRLAYDRAVQTREARMQADVERIAEEERERQRAVLAVNETIVRGNQTPPVITDLRAVNAAFRSELLAGIPQVAENPDAIAIIIGNATYQGDIPPVDYASNDARAMRQYAEVALGVRPGNIIQLENATGTQLRAVFGGPREPEGRLRNLVRPNVSEVFIFYSGHGAPDPSARKAYLMPVDADANFLSTTGYGIDVLYDNLASLGAKHVTVVLDACFSGATGGGEMLIKSASPIGIRVDDPAARFAQGSATVIAAAEGQQLANWYDEKGHGMLTYFFLKGLRGEADRDADGEVSVGEIRSYLTDPAFGVPYEARLRHNRDQTPVVFGDGARALRGRGIGRP